MMKQRRVFLWSAPRSVSTAFFRAMMNRTNTKVLLEPFATPYHYGPEKCAKHFNSKENNSYDQCTYNSVQEELQKLYQEHETVFVKDMAYFFVSRYGSDVIHYLPRGYVHTFIIRNPAKSISSLYKASSTEAWGEFVSEQVGIKELYFMFCQVTEKLQQKAIVVDADDLIQNPEVILKLYCKHTDVDFQSSMLAWDENDANSEIYKQWEWVSWFKDAFQSKSFMPPCPDGLNEKTHKELPKEVQNIIKESMEYYWKMYEVRLSFETELQSIQQ